MEKMQEKEKSREKECTPKCRSTQHANQILNYISIADNTEEIQDYSISLCYNFNTITDKSGRNILHGAATCGKTNVIKWLLKKGNEDIDARDLESGWTALHRSFFYGQLAAARILWKHNASFKVADHDGLSPMDILLKDRLSYIEYGPSDPSDVYVWGSNSNYNFGTSSSQSRLDLPELFEVFRKKFINIVQVQLCKFHSTFLSNQGHVYTCGYGLGGRLGQGSEDICLVPAKVKNMGVQTCKEVAAGQDHLLLLLNNGEVWSCGLNTYHQLGHDPPEERVLAPRIISLKHLKGKKVIGVCAARFHSVIVTNDALFTFGLNAGQLGHLKGDRTQISPRQVSTLSIQDCYFTQVEASDGATVCATSKGDIYVLHEYQIRKIASRQLDISKLSIVGGTLDSRCQVAKVREGGGLELRIALLTKGCKVHIWRQEDPYLRRCIFSHKKEILVRDLHLNHNSIALITIDNEGYLATLGAPRKARPAPTNNIRIPSIFSSKAPTGLTALLNTNECHLLQVKRLPNIYRGTSITSDSKGRNFAVLQSDPKLGLIEVPMISESTMKKDMTLLLSEANVQDDYHDIVIKVGKKEFAAHKYILASRSEYFRKLLQKDSEIKDVQIENALPEAMDQILKFIYTAHCDFFVPGYDVRWSLKKVSDKKKKNESTSAQSASPVMILQELSKKLSVTHLAKKLNVVRIVNGKVKLCHSTESPRLAFNRLSLSNFCDVTLLSSDGMEYPCHKCILIARLDYFHSMLSTSWAENLHLQKIPLPVSSPVLEAILEYIYTDNTVQISNSIDVEFLCQVLVTADQLLILRLKEICETCLTYLINLKNCAELLELSSVCNSQQLIKSSMFFICINLPSLIESRGLDILSDEVMESLTKYYRNLIPTMCKRKASFGLPTPCRDLLCLEKELIITDSRTDSHSGKPKKKRHTSLPSENKESVAKIKNLIENISLEENVLISEKSKVESLKKTQINSPEKQNQSESSGNSSYELPKPVIKENKMPDNFLSTLDEIMLEEEQKITIRDKKSPSDMKPIHRLSQKQRKQLSFSKPQSESSPIPISPPKTCSWANLPQQSPPSPSISFWDAVSKRESFSPPSRSINVFQQSPPSTMSFWDSVSKRNLSSSPSNKGFFGDNISSPKSSIASPSNCSPKFLNSPSSSNNADQVISLHEIQKDEEQKLRRLVNSQVKSLHFINIEDQAIEELCAMYKVGESHKENVIVSRVLSEEIASPVWKKKRN